MCFDLVLRFQRRNPALPPLESRSSRRTDRVDFPSPKPPPEAGLRVVTPATTWKFVLMISFAKRLLVGVLALAASGTAQHLSAEFSPNPAVPGGSVTFTITDASRSGLILSSSCGFFTIRHANLDGPPVGPLVACPQVLVPVAANGSFSFTWDQKDANGKPVGPGRYWFEATAYIPRLARFVTEQFCLSIQGPDEPALTGGVAQVGKTTGLTIFSPNDPGALYLAVVSLSSNRPITVVGLDTCVSPPLFVTPLVNALGILDASGQANLAVQVPNLPELAFQGFHVQALLASRRFRITNGLSFSIRR